MKLTAIILSFIAGCAATAGIARLSGVPVCALTNTCQTSLIETNKALQKTIAENTKRISELNAEIDKQTADLETAIAKGQHNVEQARIAVRKLDKLNMEGMNNGEKLRAIAKLVDQVRVDLHAITD